MHTCENKINTNSCRAIGQHHHPLLIANPQIGSMAKIHLVNRRAREMALPRRRSISWKARSRVARSAASFALLSDLFSALLFASLFALLIALRA